MPEDLKMLTLFEQESISRALLKLERIAAALEKIVELEQVKTDYGQRDTGTGSNDEHKTP